MQRCHTGSISLSSSSGWGIALHSKERTRDEKQVDCSKSFKQLSTDGDRVGSREVERERLQQKGTSRKPHPPGK